MPDLAVVIPTLDAAGTLGRALAALAPASARIVVADGGSTDASVAIARAAGATVVATARGRGVQLAAGAAAALAGGAGWLLFLHADTELSAE